MIASTYPIRSDIQADIASGKAVQAENISPENVHTKWTELLTLTQRLVLLPERTGELEDVKNDR